MWLVDSACRVGVCWNVRAGRHKPDAGAPNDCAVRFSDRVRCGDLSRSSSSTTWSPPEPPSVRRHTRCVSPERARCSRERWRLRPIVVESSQSSDGAHRRGGVFVHHHAMDAHIDRRRHVAGGIVEERGSMGGCAESFEGQSIDRRIGLAHAHLVAVDDVVKDVGEVHHRPPTFAQLAHVVGENSQSNSCVTQVMNQRDHGLVRDEVERNRSSGFGFGCGHGSETSFQHERGQRDAVVVHTDLATLEAMPRVVGVLAVFAHHHPHHHIGRIVGEAPHHVGRAAIARQNPSEVENDRIDGP